MKVIATDIANLTDARYFAAWGIDMMFFNVEEGTTGSLTVPEIKEIIDWVEGPQSGIKISGLSVPEELPEATNILDIDSLIIGPFIDQPSLPENIKNVFRICTLEEGWEENENLILTLATPIDRLSEDQKQKLKSISGQKKVYLDGLFKSTDLPTIESLNVTGIILKGGEEEKVGYKSFEDLDDILETLFP